MLHHDLDDLLAAKSDSMGGSIDVPAELLRAAAVVPQDKSNILQQGPADCGGAPLLCPRCRQQAGGWQW